MRKTAALGGLVAVGMACLVAGERSAAAEEPVLAEPARSRPSWRSEHDEDSIEAYSLQLHTAAVRVHVDGYGLSTGLGDEPPILQAAGPRLDGRAWAFGGGLRGTLQGDSGMRAGLGLGIYRVEGLTLAHDPLPEGVQASLGSVWMYNTELFFGKAFDAIYVYPYLDLRVSVNLLVTDLAVSTTDHGFVGNTDYFVPSLTMAPRTGLFIPVDGDWFFDVSGQYGLFGAERAAVFVGFGTWDD